MRSECNKQLKSYILANAITYANMSLGAIAIFISANSIPTNLKIACLLIILAGFTDKLDGYVARKLGVTSKLGRELDSLSDLVSFGMAPVILWWHINRGLLGIGGVLVSLFFLGGGMYRLARYNTIEEEKYIVGLPITIAGIIMGGKHLLDIKHRLESIGQSTINIENMFIMLLLSILMISSFKIKKPSLQGALPTDKTNIDN
ncbi:MAG: CDP-diacylglycerol--serine O-phosphatidyltransferase [Clostridiales bacterium]|nr:CDP-diacylglycerol--serine O-phosphatidyltransferase [Clostridiales bacterium]